MYIPPSKPMKSLARRLTTICISAIPRLAQAQAPADYGPVSADVSEIPYPHPVSKLAFKVYGKDVQMAYMDVKPTGAPNGQTVVLLHGFNFSGEAWRGTIDVLTREGFRVIVPDQIGFGRSSKPFIPYTFDDMALNTRRFVRSASTAPTSWDTRWAACSLRVSRCSSPR